MLQVLENSVNFNDSNKYDFKYKKELYKHIDLNNYIYYFNNVEKIAQKSNQFSFKILLNDLNKNVIDNDNIIKFKNKINKKLDKMEKSFKIGLISKVEELHQECLNEFYILINKEINNLISNNNHNYYLFTKQELNKKLILIYNSYIKINEKNTNEKQIVNLNMFCQNMMKDYNIRKNVLKKYYKKNKELIPFDDILYINLNNINEIENIIYKINEDNKIYDEKLLPFKIIIKETNNYEICRYKYISIDVIDIKIKYNIKDNEYKYDQYVFYIIKKLIYKILIRFNNNKMFLLNKYKYKNIFYKIKFNAFMKFIKKGIGTCFIMFNNRFFTFLFNTNKKI